MLPKLDEMDVETDRRKSGVYRHRSVQKSAQNTVSIGDAIQGSIKKLGLTAKFQEQRALSLWPEIVGEQVAGVTEAYQIKHGELLVSVQHATWQYHLMFERDNYRKQLNDVLGSEVVRLIRFTK
jgi:predicted nucleic acid-binding Zn ribbon protein